jgi:hypothetical protein
MPRNLNIGSGGSRWPAPAQTQLQWVRSTCCHVARSRRQRMIPEAFFSWTQSSRRDVVILGAIDALL